MSKQNPGLKSANQTSEYTREQIIELKLCSQDPVYFINNYVRIKHPSRGRIPFKMYQYQEDLVRMYQDNKFSITLFPRQSGKTETTAAFLLWEAIFNDEYTILIASNNSKNAMEIIAKIQYAYEELPEWLKPGINDKSWNKTSIEWENRSRIIATTTSKNSGRGLAISRVYADELAFVPQHLQLEFFNSILPTISVAGKMIISSTPNGDINLFAQLWRGAQLGTNDFKNGHMQIKWNDVPGRDEKFKEEMTGLLGERKFAQEYDCVFISSEATLIDTMIINNREREIKDHKPAFSHFGQEFYKKINPNATYIVTLDPASGSGDDFSVIEVFEFPSMEQICEVRTNTLTIAVVYTMLKNILNFLSKYTQDVYWSFENNSMGEAVGALYETDENRPGAHLVSESGKDKHGIKTTHKLKMKNCLRFKEMFESGILKLYSNILLKEMKSYVRREGSYAAQPGATDDCISSSLLLFAILEEMSTYDEKAYQIIFSKDSGANEAWEELQDGSDEEPLPYLIG